MKYVAFARPILADYYCIWGKIHVNVGEIPEVFDSQAIDAHQVPYVRRVPDLPRANSIVSENAAASLALKEPSTESLSRAADVRRIRGGQAPSLVPRSLLFVICPSPHVFPAPGHGQRGVPQLVSSLVQWPAEECSGRSDSGFLLDHNLSHQ